ncbi:hypothetical protein BV25DRAFT_1897826 [Artomyces pyxidatus]|uniref:Uncharacterized protein n=1 Tax=Artomyces pyxidatus TaxID=48021 RepID=A0ACB8TAY6_9AGAM|nr:hypothetical protein BV25DRAFT_1897826 [Artomyces pyxidatus]
MRWCVAGRLRRSKVRSMPRLAWSYPWSLAQPHADVGRSYYSVFGLRISRSKHRSSRHSCQGSGWRVLRRTPPRSPVPPPRDPYDVGTTLGCELGSHTWAVHRAAAPSTCLALGLRKRPPWRGSSMRSQRR